MFIAATELAFEQTRTAMRCYERGTGAKLNLNKLAVIPIAIDDILDWLWETRCKISMVGKVQ